ncbi:Defensin-like protein 287 [Arabidopsis thaliana]
MGKGEVTISLRCKTKTECLKNIACEACVDCRCDKGICKCHGFTAETNNPTV